MKPLVVIPARGGSKGVPGKNIKKLGKKPLIHYTVEAAREVFQDKVICVSTDDLKIKSCVEETGLRVPFIRPSELATDNAGTYDVLLHAIAYYKNHDYYPDTLILLQPTSPFRTALHIQQALALYDGECDMVVSVKETKSNPYFTLYEKSADGYMAKSKQGDFSRRQDAPSVFELNGAIYIINIKQLLQKPMNKMEKVIMYLMDEMHSHDIDTPLDWMVAENLAAAKKVI